MRQLLISIWLIAVLFTLQGSWADSEVSANSNSLTPSASATSLAELERKLELLVEKIEEQASVLARQQLEIEALREALSLRSDPPAVDAQPFAAETPEAPLEPTADWTSLHPFIASSDGHFKIEFGGRALLDYRAYESGVLPPNSFFLRRARFKVEGQLFEHYEFEVETELTDSETPLRDGFVIVNYHPGIQVRVGQFKIPFSQEEMRSTKYLEFVENSSVNHLVPGRSPGLQLYGVWLDGRVEYQTGLFNGLGKLTPNTSDTPEFYFRTHLTPFPASGLWREFSFGGAYGRGHHRGGESVAGITASKSAIFFEPVPINGHVERVNAEFSWLHSNWSVRGEFDRSLQARERLGFGGSDLPPVVGNGYVIQGTYLLTGETKTEREIRPRSPFLTAGGGLGAWELAFRYEAIRIDDSIAPNRHQAYTLGVNWWPTRFVRLSSNFILERFGDPRRAARPGKKDSFSLLSRMQVIF